MVLRLNKSLKYRDLIPTPDCSGQAPTGVPYYSGLSTPVTSARDPGQVTAIQYSCLAMSLRSLAIILPIHRHLISLASTFATVFV